MAQPIYTCPFCNSQPYRTRYMLWKHMHECIRKIKQYNPTVGLHQDELAVIGIGT